MASRSDAKTFFPSPHEHLRVVGKGRHILAMRSIVRSAGVGGCGQEKSPPTPDPSLPLRYATRGEGGK